MPKVSYCRFREANKKLLKQIRVYFTNYEPLGQSGASVGHPHKVAG
jgi:hypothetical protein